MERKSFSLRMRCISGMLPKCDRIADVGCDHGLLGLLLLQSGKCDTLVASDVSTASLQKAEKLYRDYGYSEKTETVLADGLINCGAQAAVIAGIGGSGILRIIENGLETAKGMLCLVLQPADDAAELRSGLLRMGFEIVSEQIVYENRFFPVLCTRYDGMPRQLDELGYELGPYNMAYPDKTVLGYAKWRRRIWEKSIRQPAKTGRGRQNQEKAKRLIRALAVWCEENAHASDA